VDKQDLYQTFRAHFQPPPRLVSAEFRKPSASASPEEAGQERKTMSQSTLMLVALGGVDRVEKIVGVVGLCNTNKHALDWIERLLTMGVAAVI
jgi:hypothetical protein